MKYCGIWMLVLALVLAGCGGADPTQNEKDLPVLVVGHVGHDHQIALYVAALEGEAFREEYGIGLLERKPREVYDLVVNGQAVARLMLRKVGGASAMPAAMEAGGIDVGLGGTPAVAMFIDRGQDFRIIAPLHTDGDMLVVRPDLPVEDWASFVAFVRDTPRPVRIAYKGPMAVAKLIFLRALKEEGLTYREGAGGEAPDVLLVNAGGGKNMYPLLGSGDVDGMVMNQPIPAKAVQDGAGKIVAELRHLPPKGQWENHPCCIIAARGDVLRNQPDAVKALLKVILLATQRIEDDPQAAAKYAAEWTRQPLEVEQKSVPSIPYLAEPTDEYLAGLRTWAQVMKNIHAFPADGALAKQPPERIVDMITDFRLLHEAAEELRAQGLLR